MFAEEERTSILAASLRARAESRRLLRHARDVRALIDVRMISLRNADEREMAKIERTLADDERVRAAIGDRNQPVHERVALVHDRAAELHDRAADWADARVNRSTTRPR